MSWKIILWLGVFHVSSTFSQNTSNLTLPQQKVQISIFEKFVLQTRLYWMPTPPDYNVRFIPLSLQISQFITQLKEYFDALAAFNTSNYNFFERDTSFERIVIKALENETSVQVRFKNVILYDQRYTNEAYLSYVKNRYHAETYEVSFDSNNAEKVGTLFSEWMNKIHKGKKPKIRNPWRPGMTSSQTTVLTFNGCWDAPKTSPIIAAMYSLNVGFKTSSEVLELPSFTAKERIGYYNNTQLKYEAIRIPFKENNFAMAIVLPYQNHSLELFRRLGEADYLQLLERVNENHETVEYAVPFIDSTLIVMNHNGSSIHGNDTFICDWSSVGEDHAERNITNFKEFIVDRPFGLFIYEEKTKFVLSHVLVRDPRLSTENRTTNKIPSYV